jgi:hypothetical protein
MSFAWRLITIAAFSQSVLTTPVTAKLNPRMHELIEFTAMAMDHILSDRYGDQIRDDILTDVSQNCANSCVNGSRKGFARTVRIPTRSATPDTSHAALN